MRGSSERPYVPMEVVGRADGDGLGMVHWCAAGWLLSVCCCCGCCCCCWWGGGVGDHCYAHLHACPGRPCKCCRYAADGDEMAE